MKNYKMSTLSTLGAIALSIVLSGCNNTPTCEDGLNTVRHMMSESMLSLTDSTEVELNKKCYTNGVLTNPSGLCKIYEASINIKTMPYVYLKIDKKDEDLQKVQCTISFGAEPLIYEVQNTNDGIVVSILH